MCKPIRFLKKLGSYKPMKKLKEGNMLGSNLDENSCRPSRSEIRAKS